MPPGKDPVVIMSGATIMMVKALAAVAATLSLIWTVRLEVAGAAGVPVIEPVAESNDRPAGNEPALINHVYGGVPPEKLRFCEYPIPGAPAGRDAVVMLSSGLIVMARAFAAVAVAMSFIWTVKLEVAAAPGVPVMEPAGEFRDKPAGSAPPLTDHVYGGVPPENCNVCE